MSLVSHPEIRFVFEFPSSILVQLYVCRRRNVCLRRQPVSFERLVLFSTVVSVCVGYTPHLTRPSRRLVHIFAILPPPLFTPRSLGSSLDDVFDLMRQPSVTYTALPTFAFDSVTLARYPYLARFTKLTSAPNPRLRSALTSNIVPRHRPGTCGFAD